MEKLRERSCESQRGRPVDNSKALIHWTDSGEASSEMEVMGKKRKSREHFSSPKNPQRIWRHKCFH